MKIDTIKLPPVSEKFYDRLITAFPPMNPLDVKEDTNMIQVHRNAAQQEVIQYIKQAVRKEANKAYKSNSFWERLKYVFSN